jgi:hypothetical protein
MFYHIPKTGGSTVREWLLRNAGIRSPRGSKRRSGAVVRYYDASCFFCLQFPRMFSEVACPIALVQECRFRYTTHAAPHGSFDAIKSNWREETVAVEFHAASASFFLKHVLPRMTLLRRLYLKHNGTIASATLVREPVSFLFSSFHMWPPRPEGNSHVTPFTQWVIHARGLQVGFLTTPPCTNMSRAMGHYGVCDCSGAASREALGVLARIDIVGVTACLSVFLDAIERAMQMPADTPTVRLQRRAYKGNISAGPMRATPRCSDCSSKEVLAWTWDALDADARSNTLLSAGCDQQVYHEAVRRVQRQAHVSRFEACQSSL